MVLVHQMLMKCALYASGALKYQVVYRKNGTTELPLMVEVTAPEAEVTRLDAGTWHRFKVFSVGIKDRRSEEGSEEIRLQTSKLKYM